MTHIILCKIKQGRSLRVPQTLCSRKAITSGNFSNSPFSLQTCPLTGQHPEREGRGGIITDSKRGSKEQTSLRWQRPLRTCVIQMLTPANYRVGNRKVGWEWRGGQPAPSCLFLLSAHYEIVLSGLTDIPNSPTSTPAFMFSGRCPQRASPPPCAVPAPSPLPSRRVGRGQVGPRKVIKGTALVPMPPDVWGTYPHSLLIDHFNNFLQEIAKGSHYPKKGAGMTVHMKPRCSPPRGAGWGQGRCFLGHLTRVLFLKFPFPPLFVDPNCSHAHEMRPWTSSPRPRGRGGLFLIACVLPSPQVSRAGGPIPTYASRTILIEGSSAQLTTYV